MSLIGWITLIFTSVFLRKEINQYNDKVEFADDHDENLNYLHCSNCNKIIADDSLFCMYCGKEVVGNLNSDFNEDKNVSVAELSAVKQPSMRWFNFLVKFLMPLWIFFSPISIFGKISSVIRNYYGTFSYYTTNPIDGFPNTVTLVITICVIIFLYISWNELRIFSIKGYKFTIFFFVFTIFSSVITMLVYFPFYVKEGANYDYYNMFVNMCSAAIISIPNLIYLKKRKSLFVNNELTKQIYINKKGGINNMQ